MMSAAAKPDPVVSTWARPFWEAAKEERLLIQKCEDCGEAIFYPRIACPHCGSEKVGWIEASGKGKVYTYTVVESNAPSAFIADMPFVLAVIELEEGVRLMSNIVDCDPYGIECEQQVEVAFEKRSEEFTVPVFRPVGA
jgi:hypothetical protein